MHRLSKTCGSWLLLVVSLVACSGGARGSASPTAPTAAQPTTSTSTSTTIATTSSTTSTTTTTVPSATPTSGRWAFFLGVSSACADQLPAEYRRRTWNTQLLIDGPLWVALPGPVNLAASLSGTTLTFTAFGVLEATGTEFFEVLGFSGRGLLGVGGFGRAVVDGTTSARVTYFNTTTGVIGQCTGTHAFTLGQLP